MAMTDSGTPDTPGFAAVPNWMIRDTTISPYAIAVYAALASHSGRGGIYPSHETIAAEARCSTRKVQDALAELRELGVVASMRRNGRGGRTSNSYTLHPNGMEVTAHDAVTELTPTARGGAGNGTTCRQVTAPRAEEEEPLEEEPVKNTPIPPAGVSRDVVKVTGDEDPFGMFYKVYPRHTGRLAAEKAFRAALKKATADEILAGARRFAADPNLPSREEQRFIPMPATWLNQGRWDDDPLPPRGGGSGAQKQQHSIDLVRGYQEREEQEHEEIGTGDRPRLGLVR
ncbi:helix-turn-helix domain-containing protein [Frigoribacterium sp. CFBP9030]|uniref:helix-turn-helix domain-containing protein n=1 Tax=Frigoribacterium sp. CFBP9030 TaxID=3096537 RepID=UPI002A6A6CB4|nr:helix-turn-helix domain-containing protein [Frigoribacterium sp. CFBP9030]MDY0891856.1 helix-turn-helix domain-containing protein [Frigoribacterium sp. CFBP9030]